MKRLPRLAFGFLILLHLLALGADLVAPHGWDEQRRELAFAPPMWPRLWDADGTLRAPFVYAWRPSAADPYVYEEDRSRPLPLRFWVKSAPHDFGPFQLEHRLWGLDEGENGGSWHPLGTDRFGRDVASRLLYGLRFSLLIGLVAALLGVAIGTLAGSLAGFFGGRFDGVATFLADLCLALPWIYLLLGIRAFLPLQLPPDAVLAALVILVGLLAWAQPMRLVRSLAIGLRESEFVAAARGLGSTELAVYRHHVLPHTLGPAFVQLSLLVPRCLLAEITLSFLGLGAVEPRPSLGTALAALQDQETFTSHGWLLWPAATLAMLVLSYHLLSDALQERWENANPTGESHRQSFG